MGVSCLKGHHLKAGSGDSGLQINNSTVADPIQAGG